MRSTGTAGLCRTILNFFSNCKDVVRSTGTAGLCRTILKKFSNCKDVVRSTGTDAGASAGNGDAANAAAWIHICLTEYI
eukprot:SAG22_NODE_17040_length_312_cov_1.380282_1_plen_79_part_00